MHFGSSELWPNAYSLSYNAGMSVRDFKELISAKWDEKKFLCVGLDPDLEKIPTGMHSSDIGETIFAFNVHIVDQLSDFVCAYKPNSAFYERYGAEGIAALKKTIEYIHDSFPDVPVILDAKRADIGNTNNGYVAYAFGYLQADGITVHPYMGGESLKEFFDRKDKGIFVMCRNSNSGSGEFQDLEINGRPLYQHIAQSFREKWNSNKNCGLVVGATYPDEIKKVREVAADMPFLIPGTGAQGGDLEKSVQYGKDAQGKGFLLAVSRGVIYAVSPRESARELHSAIQKFL